MYITYTCIAENFSQSQACVFFLFILLAIKGIYCFDYWKVLGYSWLQAWLGHGAKNILSG